MSEQQRPKTGVGIGFCPARACRARPKKVVDEQKPLLDRGIYFYTDLAKNRYLDWATENLVLWENVLESLKDKDVQELLAIAREQGVL